MAHPSRIQHLHKDFAGNGSQVIGVSVQVDLLVLIDVRCIYVLEFLGAGTPKLLVSVDTLFEESRLVPLDSLDVFWGDRFYQNQ